MLAPDDSRPVLLFLSTAFALLLLTVNTVVDVVVLALDGYSPLVLLGLCFNVYTILAFAFSTTLFLFYDQLTPNKRFALFLLHIVALPINIQSFWNDLARSGNVSVYLVVYEVASDVVIVLVLVLHQLKVLVSIERTSSFLRILLAVNLISIMVLLANVVIDCVELGREQFSVVYGLVMNLIMIVVFSGCCYKQYGAFRRLNSLSHTFVDASVDKAITLQLNENMDAVLTYAAVLFLAVLINLVAIMNDMEVLSGLFGVDSDVYSKELQIWELTSDLFVLSASFLNWTYFLHLIIRKIKGGKENQAQVFIH